VRDSDLTKLRRRRARIHRQLDKLEPLLADLELDHRLGGVAVEGVAQPPRDRCRHQTVVVDGRVLLSRGVFLNLDTERIRYELARIRAKVVA